MPRAILEDGRFGSGDQAIPYAIERVIDAFNLHNEIAQIRKIRDGTHMNHSLHYIDHAFDFWIAHVAEEKRDRIVADIRSALCADKKKYPYGDFDVVYGTEGHKHHGHVEWQPKRAMNR